MNDFPPVHADASVDVPVPATHPGADVRVQRHLVEAYAGPLRDFYRTTPWHRAYGHLPDWDPEVVVRDFLSAVARTGLPEAANDTLSDRPLRARLADGLRRDLRGRRRAQRSRSRIQ